MISTETFRKLALSFPETSEVPHFDKRAFRTKRKIYATLWEKDKKAVLMLSLVDQSVYCAIDKDMIYPVPNKWGLQGCTIFELSKVKKEILLEALTAAHREAAPRSK